MSIHYLVARHPRTGIMRILIDFVDRLQGNLDTRYANSVRA